MDKTDMKEIIEAWTNSLAEKNEISDAHTTFVTIPMPSLCMRYLIGYEGLPLETLILIVGQQSTFKSTLAVEMGRWCMDKGGVAYLIDTELSFSPLAKSVLTDTSRFRTVQCNSIEQWQTAIINLATKLKSTVKNQGAFPVCVIVDSILGSGSEMTTKKVLESGFADRSFPSESLTLSKFLRSKHGFLQDVPLMIIGTNHLKTRISTTNVYGGVEEYSPGGSAFEFHANLKFKVNLSPPKFRANRIEKDLTICVGKNRFGPENVHITVPIVFAKNERHETTVSFNWSMSTARLLACGDYLPKEQYNKTLKSIKEIINVQEINKGPHGTKYYCEELGISISDPVSAQELDAALEKNKGILYELYKVLGIRRAPEIKIGEPYDERQRIRSE